MLPNLGINDDSINYEVALESIGARMQPYVQAMHDEKKKSTPSQALIEYYRNRINALGDLRESLQLTDLVLIERIIGGEDQLI
ncbi:hypothetical protein AGMMS50229_10510 [Campylobacterota bacterium]|nr:hypothetical protein AGMMS50229_10510 [Campylobacterota bacterium]